MLRRVIVAMVWVVIVIVSVGAVMRVVMIVMVMSVAVCSIVAVIVAVSVSACVRKRRVIAITVTPTIVCIVEELPIIIAIIQNVQRILSCS